MRDTKPEFLELQRKILEEKSYEEKFLMSIDMYETSKAFVRSAILNEKPDISERDLKKDVFRRIYKNDLSEIEIEKIVSMF